MNKNTLVTAYLAALAAPPLWVDGMALTHSASNGYKRIKHIHSKHRRGKRK